MEAQENKKTILVDMDDTIESMCAEWIKVLNQMFKTNYTVDDIKDWDLSNLFPNATKAELLEPLHHEEFWMNVKPIEGAQEYLNRLYNEGYEIFVVTATDYRNIKAKVEHVLNPYFPFIDSKHLITAFYKSMLKADFLVDDYPNNLIYGDYNKILFTACHNKDYEPVWPNSDIHRVNTWEECYELIKNWP